MSSRPRCTRRRRPRSRKSDLFPRQTRAGRTLQALAAQPEAWRLHASAVYYFARVQTVGKVHELSSFKNRFRGFDSSHVTHRQSVSELG